MKVSIHQPWCIGCTLCHAIAPEVFTMLRDGKAYVKDGAAACTDPGGRGHRAEVPTGLEDDVIESAQECPAECIEVHQS